MMKTYLLIITVLCLIQISVFSQQIEFFNVGLQDKPMDNLIISKSNIDIDQFGTCYMGINLDEKEFSLIENYVVSRNTKQKPVKSAYHKNEEGSAGAYPYGTYAVLLTNERQDTIVFYCLENGKKTAKYFDDLISLLNTEEMIAVATEINNIIFKRISYKLDTFDQSFLKEIYRDYISCSVWWKIIPCVLLFTNILCWVLLWRSSRNIKL